MFFRSPLPEKSAADQSVSAVDNCDDVALLLPLHVVECKVFFLSSSAHVLLLRRRSVEGAFSFELRSSFASKR